MKNWFANIKESVWEWLALRKWQHGFVALQRQRENFEEKYFSDEVFYSQFKQDMFLRFLLFPDKNDGFFLDIGGNHPIKINNTYYFEKIGWKGLAFEPLKKNNSLWEGTRTTPCLPYALGKAESELDFIEYEEDYMSGLKDKVFYEGKVKETYKVKVRPLKDVLREYSIKDIDFISIDVEGGELEVLEGIDFEETNIKCILVENNKGDKKARKVRSFLRENGYYLYARLWIDDVWVKNANFDK